MKLIKTISIVFLLSVIFSISGAKADAFIGLSNITIPTGGSPWTSGEKYKDRNTAQTIQTTAMTTAMQARTYGMYGNVGYSSYIDLATDATQNLNSGYNGPNSYKLQIRCKNSNWFNEHYWGIWRYNWPV